MAKVVFTPNLQRHIACPMRQAPGGTVHTVLESVFGENPKLRTYILDDQDRLRQHVHIYINNERIIDAVTLSDNIGADDELFVFQALSGG
jgi:molybdopterin synthase sulfur carrier subunit